MKNKASDKKVPPVSEKKKYEAPVFEKEEGMEFTEEIFEEFNEKAWCFGCTNCNCN